MVMNRMPTCPLSKLRGQIFLGIASHTPLKMQVAAAHAHTLKSARFSLKTLFFPHYYLLFSSFAECLMILCCSTQLHLFLNLLYIWSMLHSNLCRGKKKKKESKLRTTIAHERLGATPVNASVNYADFVPIRVHQHNPAAAVATRDAAAPGPAAACLWHLLQNAVYFRCPALDYFLFRLGGQIYACGWFHL